MKNDYLNYLIYYDPEKKLKDIENDVNEILEDITENDKLLDK